MNINTRTLIISINNKEIYKIKNESKYWNNVDVV